ncbi:MAG: RNA polymerase factor sigma-32 [Rickettsiales bacterium]|jgi:RNA polymerase sigma-32 factor|nr:RNA polymerase factor sigma-32 [Rickettsiales bacterium]
MTQKIKTSLPAKTPKNLPVISDDNSLARYIQMVQSIPMLTATEEYNAAVAWQGGDKFSGEKLVASHLRMVVSVAYEFRHYGISVGDLISSGNLGLMQALQKFDPQRGFRFSTYAMFWIKAEIYDTILSNWSLVKIGTSANQKKIFFNLSRAKRALGIMDNNLNPEQLRQLSDKLDVPESDIEKMSTRMSARDISLNAPVRNSPDSDAAEIISTLESDDDSALDMLAAAQWRRKNYGLLAKHLAGLPARDREILQARRLADPVETLESLGAKYGISKERVRQIEERAFAKLRKAILEDKN